MLVITYVPTIHLIFTTTLIFLVAAVTAQAYLSLLEGELQPKYGSPICADWHYSTVTYLIKMNITNVGQVLKVHYVVSGKKL